MAPDSSVLIALHLNPSSDTDTTVRLLLSRKSAWLARLTGIFSLCEFAEAVAAFASRLILERNSLGICYAFYYIDKTTLSYAALFGLKNPVAKGGLGLHGTQYSWLSSAFYCEPLYSAAIELLLGYGGIQS